MIPTLPNTTTTPGTGGAAATGGKDSDVEGGDGTVDSSEPPESSSVRGVSY